MKKTLHEPVRKVRTRRTISPEEKRRVTVYLRGPKVDGLYSERVKLQEAISRFYGTKRKWTFNFDDRIFTCDLTAKEIEDLKKNTDIIEKIVEHKEDEVGIMISYPYPDFDPDNENIDWGVSAINAPTAWSAGYTGKGIKLAIIDTGVAYNHIDLKDRYIAGYNAITGSDDPLDDHGHGTWCAGIACASANDIGYKGVAPEVDLYAAKVLSARGGGTWADVAAGIDWATQQGVDVISMSLGGTMPDETVENACANAWARGIVIVVAAGNNGPGMGTVTYPAKYSSCMAVAAIDYQKYVAWFSSRGAEVEIAAPGVGVTGCWPGRHLDMYGDGQHFVGDYWYWANGTCLTGDTEIYTPSGPKQIKDLKEGDEVFCFDKGQLTKNKVKKLLRQGVKKVFKIETSDGKNIKATSNHPFLVSETRSSRLIWKPVSELQIGDLLVAVNKSLETFDFSISVKNIEPVGMREVFDIEVENSHNFLANGIVVHNSGATPHIAGAACLVKQWYPRATNQEIRDFLNNNAEDL